VAKGLTVDHEPVGVIEKLGSAVQGYQEGQRMIAGAICPNFNSYAAQDGAPSQDGSYLVASSRCGCGFVGAENANIKIGDTVVVFAQGPIGLCATAGAKLRGASFCCSGQRSAPCA